MHGVLGAGVALLSVTHEERAIVIDYRVSSVLVFLFADEFSKESHFFVLVRFEVEVVVLGSSKAEMVVIEGFPSNFDLGCGYIKIQFFFAIVVVSPPLDNLYNFFDLSFLDSLFDFLRFSPDLSFGDLPSTPVILITGLSHIKATLLFVFTFNIHYAGT